MLLRFLWLIVAVLCLSRGTNKRVARSPSQWSRTRSLCAHDVSVIAIKKKSTKKKTNGSTLRLGPHHVKEPFKRFGSFVNVTTLVSSSSKRRQRNMAAPGTKSRLFRCVKSILYALLFITISILTIATLRTFSLNVNVGLQLADWEKTNQIRFDISQRQREEVFTNFKGAIVFPLFKNVSHLIR